MRRNHPFAPISNRKRLNGKRFLTLHNGSGITSFKPRRRGKLAALFDALALASTVLGLIILWHTGVINA